MATEHAFDPQDTLSALADGQLRGEAFAQAVEQVANQPEAQATWHAYHVVGDVLRSNEFAECAGDMDFLARFQSRLAQEPALVPMVNAANLIAIKAYASSAEAVFDAENAPVDVAANEPRFAWKLVAGLASLVAVVAVSWNVLGGLGATPPAAQLAQAVTEPVAQVQQTVALAGAEPQVMLRDARLDALMAAHKQVGGTSALQMPAGFLRNATFESPAP
ncbi:anti sigma-E protein, RseA [Rhodoferax sp. OV413]|uniref:sigma-E factor negative regulatory protein n=1 Tax=Rhodoferax sp. OV413 TaxID=1855285 RepID=UPI00087F2B36|nr:sigma-E factor negative regulatory protein [Rhodoferax sp. OV413]SDP18284.1 anti sigma-E protein, RseA [Rhodoferax sp. OV413]